MTGLGDLVHLQRPPAGDPAGLLVLFHGRGADERDLFGLLDALDPERRLLGVTPRGPQTYFPPGGAHWYKLQRVGFPDPATFRATYARLGRWLQALWDGVGLGPKDTVLGGFSQGAVMAYAMALGAGRPSVAGVMAFSGFMANLDGFEHDLVDRAGFPVAIAHGSYDPVIPVDFGLAARERLEASGAEVTYRESPIAHGIDPETVADFAGWLGGRFT